MNELSEYACELAEQGYYVLPLLIRDDHRKIPLIKWGSNASRDPELIRAMPWDEATHVAVACEPSGIVVVDLDTYYDEDQEELIEGEELLKEWQQLVYDHYAPNDFGDLAADMPEYDPPWALTNSNGVHAFFRADPDHPVNNSAKEIRHCIDTRGVGGQFGGIVAIYADMPEIDDLPTSPAWLSELTQQQQGTHRTPKAPPKAPVYPDGEAGTPLGLRELDKRLRKIEELWDADEGQFNEKLVGLSYGVGQFVGAGQLDYGHAYTSLTDKLAELSAPADQYKTIESGFSAGFDRPWVALTLSNEQVDEAARNWVSGDALDQLPPPKWLVPGWLELNSVAQIYGEPGVGKSFIALDIACRVSRGMGWPTRDNTPAHAFKVAYVIAEGVFGLAERKRAWEHTHGKIGDMKFHPQAIQIMGDDRKPLEWEAASEFLAQWGPSLVIVDTQARCTLGVEENSPKEMGQVYDKIEDLQRKTGACVLLIHHTSKGGQTARGTNAVRGAIATEIHLRKSYGRIRVKCSKQKDAVEPNDVYFKLTESGASVIPELSIEMPEDMESSVQASNTKMLIRQYLRDHMDIPQTTKEIVSAIEVSRPTVSGHLTQMVEDNELIKSTVRRDNTNQSAYLWNPPMSESASEG